MKIKYLNTKSDVESSTKSLYINSFYRIIILYSLFAILIVAITLVKNAKLSLNILYFIIPIFIILFIKFYLIPIKKIKDNLKNQIQNNPNYLSEETLFIQKDGFEVNSKRYDKPQFFNWQSIKYTYTTAKYYLIVLHNEKLILINKTNSEPQNVLPNILPWSNRGYAKPCR